MIMARTGVNCRRPPPSLTRVIDDRRIVKTGGSGRQVHGSSRCTSCSVLSSWMAFSTTCRSLRSTPRSMRARRSVRRDLNSFRHRRRHAKWAAELPRPRRPGRSQGSRAKRSRQRTTTASSHSPYGQLDVVGGAGAHPDELPRRVMTTHPEAVDAGTRMASGGSVEARKYRTCGHGSVKRGSALEGTCLDAGATKTTLVAEIRSTRCFSGCSSGFRELRSGFVRVQLAAHVQRQKEDDAMTGTAASRRSRIWSSRSSKGWVVEQGRTTLPHRSPAAGPCLTRASGGQPQRVPILFAMAGT